MNGLGEVVPVNVLSDIQRNHKIAVRIARFHNILGRKELERWKKALAVAGRWPGNRNGTMKESEIWGDGKQAFSNSLNA